MTVEEAALSRNAFTLIQPFNDMDISNLLSFPHT